MRRTAPTASTTAEPTPRAALAGLRLAVLVAVVVLAHLALLAALPAGTLQGHAEREHVPRFVMRVLPAPPPPAPVEAPRTPSPTPRARAAQPPLPATAAPAPEGVPDADTIGTATAAASASEADGAPAAEPAAPPPPPEPPPAPPAPPVGIPAPVRLRYAMDGNSRGLVYHARAELLWQQDGAAYQARMEVSAFLIGSRVQTSQGRIGAAGLEPERFSDKWRTEVATHFDRTQNRIVFSANTPEAPLPPGVQDRLGVFFQLAAQLSGDPARYPVGSTITVPTAGPRSLEDWSFTVGAPETLELPAGTQRAVKLERVPRKEYDTRVEVWFAPALGWLPVRMRITQAGGDSIDQRLLAVEQP